MEQDTYFVSYQFKNVNGDHGFGRCFVNAPLKTGDDIDKASELLKEKNKFDGVVILFFTKMEGK
jgi:hypothetical protein